MLANLIRRQAARSNAGQLGWPDYLRLWEQFGYNGTTYMVPNGAMSAITALQGMRNPIIQAAIVLRMMAFSEIHFAFQAWQPGQAGRDLFSGPGLDLLEQPFPQGSTGDLLARMEGDVSLYGNSYWYASTSLPTLGAARPQKQLTWLDPTRMVILTGDQTNPRSGRTAGKYLLAYQLQDKSGQPEETFLPNEVAHDRPVPDPQHPYRGLSWLSSLMGDIQADQDMTVYKHAFLTNAATPNLVVSFTNNIGQDAFNAFRDRMEASHTGPSQGFKTLYLGAGADVKVVGSNWAELNLADTQSYGETRLAVAAGVPASLLGIAEGMKGATLNTANYAATRRRFSDITIRPLWRMACSALETLVPPPPGARLWYDERDIAFLMADLQDQAAVRTADSATVVNLTNAGYTPESVVKAVISNDWSVLEHSGFQSVQLQPVPIPAAASPSVAEEDQGNGNSQDGGDSGNA